MLLPLGGVAYTYRELWEQAGYMPPSWSRRG